MDDSSQRNNFQSFYRPVEMPGGYTFNHADNLRMIDLYYNSKFKTGQFDKKGFRKFFYNIVKPASDIATKFVDLDTKDIILIPEAPGHELKVWMMQRKLKQWLKDEDFGCLLNEIAEDYPKYGTVVVKMTKDGVQKVNLQNLRMDPSAKCFDESFVYELMPMTKGDIEGMKAWDQTKIQELFGRGDDQIFFLYDCYDPSGGEWKHVVKADLFSKKKRGGGINRSTESEINTGNESFFGSLTLFEETLGEEELPYRELHWEKLPGRWMGRGFVEYLEDNQIALNETTNIERKGIHFKGLQLWQTRDESIGGSNVLSDAENGDILRVESEITPIAKDNADLAAFNNSNSSWLTNVERKTFTTDITTGSNLPSRTPLGVANLQATLATSYFDLKRENFGLFLKDLILEDIIPSFKNESFKEHVLTFTSSDDELDKLDATITDIQVNDAVVKYALKHGYYPSKIMRDDLASRLTSEIKKNKYRYVKVPEGFYADAKYILDVNITNEAIDNGTKSQVLQLALQIIGTNPGILQMPAAKAILFSLLSLGGVSPVEIGLLNDQANQGNAQPQPQQQQPGAPASGPQVTGSLAKQSPLVTTAGRASTLL